MTTTNLTSIHVDVAINGKARRRPLRMYSHDTFGVVVKGACHPVTPTTRANVVALAKGAPKAPEMCRAAKLADLGVAKSAKPMPEFIKARKGKPVPSMTTPDGIQLTVDDVIALLLKGGIQFKSA